MFEYLKGLSEENSEAVINTEGRICVMASESAVKEEVILRHYAFLLDYMSVPVDKILLVTLDDTVAGSLLKRFQKLYPGLPFHINLLSKLDKAQDYEYVIVRDAHNLDVFSVDNFRSLCEGAKNLFVFVNIKKIRKHLNIDLAEYLEKNKFEVEIDTDRKYSVGKYLYEVGEWLEKRRKDRELEEKRQREAAEQRARIEAERNAAEEKARIEAERKAREEVERKAREEAERIAKAEVEGIAREKADEEALRTVMEEENRRRLSHPYYMKLQPYIAWYKKNWQFMVEHGAHRWEAVQCFKDHFDLDSKNLSANLTLSLSRTGELMTGVLMNSQKMLIKCASICPNETRLLLRNLINENDSFNLRMMLYRNMTDHLAGEMRHRSSISNENMKNLNDVRVAATYITLAHPDKHYLFRLSTFQQFCSKVGIKGPEVTDFENEYEKFEEICEKVREVLMFDKDLLKMSNDSYKNDISEYHLLTFDFIYAVGHYLEDLRRKPKH